MKILEKTLTYSQVISQNNARELMLTGLFTFLIAIFPALLAHTPNNQWITGTLVNATIFIAASRLPLKNVFLICLIPSTVALWRGLLPLPMVSVLPFIVISNFVLVLIFKLTVKQNEILAIALSSFFKFLLLYLTANFLLNAVSPVLTFMLGWPQLITALAGGLIFIALNKAIKK